MRTNIDSLINEQSADISSQQRDYLQVVFAWMTAGLLITAFVSYLVINSPIVLSFVFANNITFFGLIIAKLGLVWYLSARIESISVQSARILFIVYSALSGVTFSAIFLAYTASSITQVFLICAGMFATMSFIGYVTKKDLSSFGSLFMMGIIGLIIAGVINSFLGSSMLDFIISFVGVLIFTGLTAYDTQKIKEQAVILQSNSEALSKFAIIGALNLYLDFVNLFFYLLRLMGNRR